MVLEKKGSARVEAGQRRVLDEATRQRRLTRQLEALEKDNFQDDPLSSLPPPGPTARLPAFSETEEPEEEEDEGRPLQAAIQEELHHAAGRGGEAGAELPVCGGPSLLSATPSLLLRLWFPLSLHLHHLWGALLQQQVSVYTQRDQVFEVDTLTATSSPW
ncbi:zinc finger HIT domain-containing protein 1 isoform X1 [Enoplosus armatus]|uniref:zinc finger HIT domain-containing protein 1 isoform X1 n=1 Tax=Enoplosus armatus TaxID=215367 RepID=UPI003991B46E